MKKHILLLFVSILGISCYAQRSMWHSICVYGDTVETYLCSSIDSISYSVDDEDAILQNIWNRNVNITERVASVDSILFYNPYTENIVEINEGINLWDKAYVTPIGFFRYKSSMPFIEEGDKDEFEVLSYVSFDKQKSAYMVFDKSTHLPLCIYTDTMAVHIDYLPDSLCAFTIVADSGVKDDFEFEFSLSDIERRPEYADDELKRCLWNLMIVFEKEQSDITNTPNSINTFPISVSEADGTIATVVNDRFEFTSPKYTFKSPITSLRFTFLESYNTNGKAALDSGLYPQIAIAEFYLYDANGNPIDLIVSNFSTNAQETIEGPMENICDDNKSTFWHSAWTFSVGTYHYLDVTIPDGLDLTSFCFGWTSRYTAQVVPKTVMVTGTTEPLRIYSFNGIKDCVETFKSLLDIEKVEFNESNITLPKVNGEFVFALSSANDSNSVSSAYYPVYVVTGDSYNTTTSSTTLTGAIHSVNTIYTKQGVYGIICDENSDSLSLHAADYILYDRAMIASFNYSIDCRGLKPSTEYFYRAFYVEDEVNEDVQPDILYGDVLSFSTLSPTVKTGDCIEVRDRSTTIECYYYNIPNDAICGVVLSWDGGERYVTSDDSINSLKSYNISKLIPSTKYSYRAFAEFGDTIYYGENKAFTTKKLDMTGRWAFKRGDSFYIVDFYADGTTSKYDGVNYFRWTVNGRELNLDVKNDFASSWNSPWIEYRGTFDEDFAFVSGNEYRCMFVGTNYDYVEQVEGEFTLNKYIVSTGKCLEYNLNSATVQCYYENVPEGAECGIILSWDEGVDTIPSSSEEATKVFVLNNLTSFKTYTYCGYIKYGGKIYTGGNKTFMPKHPVIPDLSGTWVFDQSFYWVKTVNLEFVKSGDGWVEYKYSEGSSSLTCTIYADQKVTINIYISGGYSSRATFEGVTNETFTSFSGDSYSTSSSNGVNVRVDTVNDPWVFCRP